MPYSHMAEHVRSKGRGDDTMLVHMTPHEVGGLQALAMAHGGSLTINPDTGLPEAGWLSKLLPVLIGVGLNFALPGLGAGVMGVVGALGGTSVVAGGLTAIGATAITGSLKKGLMAGLSAYGGASLAGGIQGALGSAAKAAVPGAVSGGAPIDLLAQIPGGAVGSGVGNAVTTSVLPSGGISSIVSGAPTAIAKTGLPAFFQGFADTAKGTLPGILGKAAVPLATTGLIGGVSNAFTPTSKKPKEPVDEYGYTGPYTMQREELAATPLALGARPAEFDPTKAYGTPRFFGGATLRNAAGNIYIPGQKTTPTAANASSFSANPINPLGLPQSGTNNPNLTPEQLAMLQQSGTNNPNLLNLTPEQLAMLQQYGTPQGYADGGQVGDSTFTFPSQMSEQQSQMMPQPSPQFTQQDQQPSPYMQQSSYGQPQQGNNPNGLGQISNLPGLARGGEVPLRHGSFVVDARTVSELGNGSSGAGQDLLARLGGMAIRGPGDGVSDSVRANIGGRQQARVARDEVQFSPGAVQRLGKGSHQRGTKKLYALMNKAQTARKNAKRGQDTGLRRGVA